MKTILHALALCALSWFGANQAHGQPGWTREFGTSGDDYGYAVALDATGVYVAGYVGRYTGAALPGQVSAGGPDAFVRKYDAAGNVLWTRQFGSPDVDHARGVAAGAAGVYVGGYSYGVLPGQTSAGGGDVFLRKFDANGNHVWTRQFGTPGEDNAYGIAADGTGVYVAGRTSMALAGETAAGNGDAFLRKYDADGNALWTRQFGTPGNDYAYAVAVVSAGVVVAGSTRGSFPGGANAGGYDAFVRCFDANGNHLWTRQFGTSSEDYGYAVGADGTGVYAGGWTEGAFPGQSRMGSVDAYVQKFDWNGNLLWVRQFGSASADGAGGIAVDGTGVYVSGGTEGVLPGQDSGTQGGMFVRKYDGSGTALWTRQFGSTGDEYAPAIAVGAGGLFVAGVTSGSLPGNTNEGFHDAFVLRLDPLLPSLRFVSVTPCRVADTRAGQGTAGPFGPPTLLGNTTRTIPIPEGRCGIPADAHAYSFNVTVVPQEPLGYLTLWPSGQPQPFVSTLNSFHGGVVANAAIVPAGAGGAVSAFVTNPTDLILDINGYFTAESSPQALSFYPRTPCRVADTRGPFTGAFGPPSLAGNAMRSFPLPDGSCGIPSWAAAHSLNATVVPAQALSYLTLWPTGQPQPFVSTLNSFDGTVVANAAIVPAGTNGAISAFATDKTDLILDANGFFGAPGNPGERTFRPVTPCRVADTRLEGSGGQMFGGETRDFAIGGMCGVPTDAKGYSLNVTVVPAGPLAYLSLWPAGTTQPVVSTLNSFLGRVVANAALAPAGLNGAVSVYVTDPTHVILDINGYFQ